VTIPAPRARGGGEIDGFPRATYRRAPAMNTPERHERQARVRMQRLAELGTLLAGFAHEVRNPLSTISLNLQLVLEDCRDPETPREKRIQKRVATVESEVRRLQTILEEFLSFARAPEPKPQPVDLNARLAAQIEFHGPALHERGIALRFFPGADVGAVTADWDHLQGAFVNLLRNAGDATPFGGEVLVSTLRDGDDVLVRVTDTGSGIPLAVQPRVFEPYFSTKKTGTGLGLPTVRRVVEEHGGSIAFTSEPGVGTQFTVRLPGLATNGGERGASA
jgi:signal transduction histidine kinase